MQTLMLLAAGYLVLGAKPSTTAAPTPSAPAPVKSAGGSDLAAAFGAFVGGLIKSATDD